MPTTTPIRQTPIAEKVSMPSRGRIIENKLEGEMLDSEPGSMNMRPSRHRP